MMIGEQYHLTSLIMDKNEKSFQFGKDLYEEKKFAGKSKFSKNFYQIKEPLY